MTTTAGGWPRLQGGSRGDFGGNTRARFAYTDLLACTRSWCTRRVYRAVMLQCVARSARKTEAGVYVRDDGSQTSSGARRTVSLAAAAGHR